MDKITEDEKKVDELRRRTIADVTPKMLEDISVFYRFAKARDFNLAEAEDMLRKHIAWRKELGIDTILTDYKPPEVLVKYTGTTFLCFDKKGRLVRFIDCGRTDANGLWNAVGRSEMEKYCAYIAEQDIARMIKSGRNLGKPLYLAIDDFENLTYSNAMSIKTAQYLIYLLKRFMDNYPETIDALIVINAPFFFTFLYALVKPIFPTTVLQKLRIFGADGWKKFLSEEIDVRMLPECYGGIRTDPDGNPLCNTIINRGKPIPKSHVKGKGTTKKLSQKSDVKTLTVKPLSKEEISFEIKEENCHFIFEYETTNRDIDFALIFKGKTDFDSEELIPKQRIDTSGEPGNGCIKCEKVGIYTLVFDNSYSWFHTKEVFYRVVIRCAEKEKILTSF